MTNNSQREELIEQIKANCTDECGYLSAEMVGYLILADRARIVEPLVKLDDGKNYCKFEYVKAKNETLTLALGEKYD